MSDANEHNEYRPECKSYLIHLVSIELSKNGLSTPAFTSWVTSLGHKTRLNCVEQTGEGQEEAGEFFDMAFLPAVVSLVLAKLEKIEASFRPLLQVQVNCEVTNCGLYHHRHVVGGLWKVHSLINLDDLTYRIYISLAVERKPTETL